MICRSLAALLPLLGLLAACDPSDEDIARNLASPNPVVREDTAKIAKNFGSDAVNLSLIGALKDESPRVRRNAVDSLAELEAVSAVPALVAVLETETDETVKKQAIDALGRLDDRAALPALLALVEADETNPPLNAIWALGRVGDASAVPVLSRLSVSTDTYIAWNARLALRDLKP